MKIGCSILIIFFAGSAYALGGNEGGLVGSGGWSGGPGNSIFADGGGDAGGGCCLAFPPEKDQLIKELEQSFRDTDFDDLRRQRDAETLCDNHPCLDNFTEVEAKEALDSFVADMRRKEDLAVSKRANGIAILSSIFSALAALASVWALWQTHHANKLARESSERSLRNEIHIETLMEK